MARLPLCIEAMNDDLSSPIPGRLRAEGFAVAIGRMTTADGRRIWTANATRESENWSAFGEELSIVLFELERQIQDAETDWQEPVADEMRETARILLGNRTEAAA